MNGLVQIEQALNTLRQYIERTIQKIGVIFGQIIFKVFQGEIHTVAVNPRIVVSSAHDVVPDQVTFDLDGALSIPPSVRQALDTLMVSKFGRVLVEINKGVVDRICVCSEIRFA